MMIPCINKGCKNKSYVPKTMVQRHKIKDIICNSCAGKVQEKYRNMSLKGIDTLSKPYFNTINHSS